MKLQQPLVCICIPSYNNVTTVSEMLDSILNQTYQNIIIKIFDNSSTDGSMAIFKKYQEKYCNIQVFQNKTNIGGEANFTKCIEHMEGRYAAIFHADDVYLPSMIEEQVKFLEMNLKCNAVSTHAHVINSKSQITGQRYLPQKFKNIEHFVFDNVAHLLKTTLRYGNIITCPTVMGRTRIYKNNIQQWNGADYKTSADLDVWFRFLQFGKFGFITKPLIGYRVSDASYSYNLARRRTEEHDIFLVLNRYLDADNIKSYLSHEDMIGYKFLVLKDNINRTINLMIQGNPSRLRMKVFSMDILFYSLKNRKIMIYLLGIFIVLLRWLALSRAAKRFLYVLRFNL